MKKLASLILLSCLLSGCFFRPHKMDIEQGNIITPAEVSQLHPGMSENQVRSVMGSPMLTNIFTPNRIEYVYTLKEGYSTMTEKKVTCIFQNGRLVDIVRA